MAIYRDQLEIGGFVCPIGTAQGNADRTSLATVSQCFSMTEEFSVTVALTARNGLLHLTLNDGDIGTFQRCARF